jgi:hypothetical protein
VDHGQEDVLGKSGIQRRSHGIPPAKNLRPKQNQCTAGYGGGPYRRENNYPNPDEASCALAHCHNASILKCPPPVTSSFKS